MRALLAAELLKLRTTRAPRLLLVAALALVIAGVGGGIASGADVRLAATADEAIGHAGLASLLSLLLGITAVAGEYRHRTITDTYLATPRRGRVVLAKLGLYTLAGAAFGIASAVVAILVTAAWFASKGGALDLASAELWRTIAGGVAWNAAFAALGVGVGALIRNLAGAIAVALAWLALGEGIVGQLLGEHGRWLPFASGLALNHGPGASDLPQGTAGLVLAGYATACAALALATTVRRDA